MTSTASRCISGSRRIGAADREQRQQREIARERQQYADLARHPPHPPGDPAILQGISTPSTHQIGQRSTPTARKTRAVATTWAKPGRSRSSGFRHLETGLRW